MLDTEQLTFNVEQGMDREIWSDHGLSVSFDGQDWALCSRTSPDVSSKISSFAANALISLWAFWVKEIEEQDAIELRQERECE